MYGPDYWIPRYGGGWIRRFSAAPVFGASASLLRGAAMLWRGRYGAGRVVGAEANQLGGVMRDLAQHWTEAAANWTARLLPEEAVGTDGGYLLVKFRDRRRFSLADGVAPVQHPEAARRLVQAALETSTDRLEAIRASGRDVGDYGKDADRWEDRFEALGETSLGIPPRVPLSEEGRLAIERFAAYRACEGLAASAGNVYAFHGHWRDADRKRPVQADAWIAHQKRFREKAAKAYHAFAAGPGPLPDETQALLSVRDDAIPYLEFAEFHSYGEADRNGAALIAALHISLVLASADPPAAEAWSDEVLTPAMKAAGVKRLAPPPKTLPAPA